MKMEHLMKNPSVAEAKRVLAFTIETMALFSTFALSITVGSPKMAWVAG